MEKPLRIIDDLRIQTSELLEKGRRLQLEGYYDTNVGELARNAAAPWERALKASDQRYRDWVLNSIIQDLDAQGWQYASHVHVLRLAANKDKHEAQPRHNLIKITAALEGAVAGLESLDHFLPGILDQMPEQLRRRTVVCAIYEFFHAGETQYSFLSAGPDDTWRSVREWDAFQVENKNSSEIEDELAKFEDWTKGPSDLKFLEQSLLESDHEFWGLMRFTASYQEIIELMAPYQHNFSLLQGLHREDYPSNIIASIATAVVTGKSAPSLTSRSKQLNVRVQERVSTFLARVRTPPGATGVDRCDARGFQEALATAISVDQELGMLVTEKGLVFVRV